MRTPAEVVERWRAATERISWADRLAEHVARKREARPLVIYIRCPRCLAIIDQFSETDASRPERLLVEADRWGQLALRRHRCTEPL